MPAVLKISLIMALMLTVAICAFVLSELDMYVTFLFYLVFIGATTVDVHVVAPNLEVIRPRLVTRLYHGASIVK